MVLNLRSVSCWFCRFGAMTWSKSTSRPSTTAQQLFMRTLRRCDAHQLEWLRCLTNQQVCQKVSILHHRIWSHTTPVSRIARSTTTEMETCHIINKWRDSLTEVSGVLSQICKLEVHRLKTVTVSCPEYNEHRRLRRGMNFPSIKSFVLGDSVSVGFCLNYHAQPAAKVNTIMAIGPNHSMARVSINKKKSNNRNSLSTSSPFPLRLPLS